MTASQESPSESACELHGPTCAPDAPSCLRCGGDEDLMDRGMAPGMTYCAPCRNALHKCPCACHRVGWFHADEHGAEKSCACGTLGAEE